jgi:DNA-binding GntR family transcriptional regulator
MGQNSIVKDLKKEIARGKMEPGQRLTEVSLCEKYKVGRSKVREALRRLEAEGFVQIIPNTGAVVKELAQKDIEQIYDLMGVLEGLAVRVAAPLVSQNDIDQIEEFVEKMEEAENEYDFFYWNFRFHSFLDSLSQNERLIKYNENLRDQAARISLRSIYNPGQVRASFREHRNIVDAIKERNPVKAEKAIREHYLRSKDRLIKYFSRSL